MYTKIIHLNNNSASLKSSVENNFVIHSTLNCFERHDKSSSLSIKLVLSGTERYKIDTKRYDLNAGEFLLVEKQQEVNISFNEKKIAEGMCFYLDEKYLKQILSIINKGAEWGLDNCREYKTQNYSLLAKKYKLNNSSFGFYLKRLSNQIRMDRNLLLTEDFFLEFAFNLVQHQNALFSSVNKLGSVKLSTRKELYCRVEMAKEYIDQNISDFINIERLAKVSNLSEVQLHRSFKQIIGRTPHQYILERKMVKAAPLIKSKKQSFSDIAFSLGFSDLPTFSKAFKRTYLMSPSEFQKSI